MRVHCFTQVPVVTYACGLSYRPCDLLLEIPDSMKVIDGRQYKAMNDEVDKALVSRVDAATKCRLYLKEKLLREMRREASVSTLRVTDWTASLSDVLNTWPDNDSIGEAVKKRLAVCHRVSEDAFRESRNIFRVFATRTLYDSAWKAPCNECSCSRTAIGIMQRCFNSV